MDTCHAHSKQNQGDIAILISYKTNFKVLLDTEKFHKIKLLTPYKNMTILNSFAQSHWEIFSSGLQKLIEKKNRQNILRIKMIKNMIVN